MKPNSSFLLLFLLSTSIVSISSYSGEQQPINPSDFTSGRNTVPAFPLAQSQNTTTCRLDLSAELFGGVAEACGRGLDRSRCCPVLAAWLFAAHARAALVVEPSPSQPSDAGGQDGPLMPDDNQKCVDSLQSALEKREVRLARPNATCDAVLCFCGIRLHQIGSLRCPAAFDVVGGEGAAGGGARNATPTAAVRDLERNCRNASYAGCTRCLQSLEKLKGHEKESTDRANRMFGRDCQLMGLTWLLARNKTAYIPTVSAVLRAILFSAHPPTHGGYKCSPDQENMPLAVDSLQFQRLGEDSNSASAPALASFSFHALLGFVSLILVHGVV
ncbi:uncharacterized GPI-anchored protein At4g28100 [Typha angustifolia]|uniref:uncharacterized GPI-anchored protein At4g28100 n=1 Tax=Typha angustifolia TaxID=59011 RepID=UPI003C2B3DD9